MARAVGPTGPTPCRQRAGRGRRIEGSVAAQRCAALGEVPVRLLITGMGGELGTRVAQLLEELPSVEAVAGLDVEPPRRRLRRAEFHRIDPRDRHRTVAVVRAFEPTAVVHLGVYEPNARSSPRSAYERTVAGSIAAPIRPAIL